MSDSPEVTSDPLVRVQDVRSLNLCMAGARLWIKEHGFDWNTFVYQGYPASVFDATGDHLITQVTDAARKRVKNNG